MTAPLPDEMMPWGTLAERLRLQDPDITDDDIYLLVLRYVDSDDGERFWREILDPAAESGMNAAFNVLGLSS